MQPIPSNIPPISRRSSTQKVGMERSPRRKLSTIFSPRSETPPPDSSLQPSYDQEDAFNSTSSRKISSSLRKIRPRKITTPNSLSNKSSSIRLGGGTWNSEHYSPSKASNKIGNDEQEKKKGTLTDMIIVYDGGRS